MGKRQVWRVAVLLLMPFAACFGAEPAREAARPKVGFELSASFLGRSGDLASGDDANINVTYGQTQCNFLFCYTPTDWTWYENGGYQIAYQDAPRIGARLLILRYGWVGLSVEQVKGQFSANLDSNADIDTSPRRYVLGDVEGQRLSLSAGGRWTWREGSPHPVDLYGGMSIDLSDEGLANTRPICVSAQGCDEYRVRATTGAGEGLLLGAAVGLSRSWYLAAELTLHAKEWDFAYEYQGEGTGPLQDRQDHIEQSDSAVGLMLVYRR